MKAQKIYDGQRLLGIYDGKMMHDFFERTTGEPSPSGQVEIDGLEVRRFVAESIGLMVMSDSRTDAVEHIEIDKVKKFFDI